MKLAIFGATSPLGQRVVELASQRGHQLRLLSRKPLDSSHLAIQPTVIMGDYFNRGHISATLQGVDAVISTIGPPQHRNTQLRAQDYANAMQQLIDAMLTMEVKRIITVASAGTRFADEPYGIWRRQIRSLLGFIAPLVIPSKELELELLSRSSLVWTCVRPPMIVQRPNTQLIASAENPVGTRVDREQLANFLLDQLEQASWHRQAPFVASQ